MQEIWSFGSVIALWLGISFGLWWLHRRSAHARQRRELDQAVRAAALAAEASPVFDAIRTPVPLSRPPADPEALLAAETHALLKRIQDRGAFFDQVNALRVQMQASFGLEDYQPLSEILHIRRDLWAASEIVLVEDLSGFGGSFAEEGAYERFRGEAVALLFKTAGAGAGEDDVIDLRLSLARQDAERFIVELKDAIAAARERDRLPTLSEIIAYPIAAIRAAPEKLRIARNFISAFFAYSGDIARSIRDSETMERSRRHLQTAREELPQRLSAGFERASAATRESAGHLRRHYDFLVAAHDFQARYERVLARAPELTERGRQFIARLELAEKSERLRLTSANVTIWVARRLVDVLAHFIAGLQIIFGALSRTTPYAFIAALFAPAPMRGRLTSAFPSYRMALTASGLHEERTALEVQPAPRPVEPTKAKSASKRTASSQTKQKHKPEKVSRSKAVAVAPANAKAETKPEEAKAAEAKEASTKAKARSGRARAKAEIAIVPPSPPVSIEPKADIRPTTSPAIAAAPAPVAKPQKAGKAKEAEPLRFIPKRSKPAVADVQTPKPAAEKAPPVEPATDVARTEPEKRPSFFARLFGGGKSTSSQPVAEPLPPAEPEPEPFEIPEIPVADVAETKPTLLARLSELGDEIPDSAAETGDAAEDSAESEPLDEADETSEEAGPLTLSLMDLKSKDPQKPSPIRSFPWLRGY
jgi:hypothetical protein